MKNYLPSFTTACGSGLARFSSSLLSVKTLNHGSVEQIRRVFEQIRRVFEDNLGIIFVISK